MTPRQQNFADLYLKYLNGARAYKEVYGSNDRTSEVRASKLLSNIEIQTYIKKERDKAAKKLEITKTRILKELARIAFGDIRELLKVDDDENVRIKSSDEWTDNAARGVSSVTTVDGPMGRKHKLRLHDKLKALHMLSLHTGLLNDKDGPKDDSADREPIADSVSTALGKLKD